MYMFIIIGQEGNPCQIAAFDRASSPTASRKASVSLAAVELTKLNPLISDTPKEHKNGGLEDHVPF